MDCRHFQHSHCAENLGVSVGIQAVNSLMEKKTITNSCSALSQLQICFLLFLFDEGLLCTLFLNDLKPSWKVITKSCSALYQLLNSWFLFFFIEASGLWKLQSYYRESWWSQLTKLVIFFVLFKRIIQDIKSKSDSIFQD